MRTILALLVVAIALPAAAADPVLADFSTDPPTAVVVDVIDLATGTQVGNNLAATQVTRDSVLQPQWRFDLSTVSGFPVGCERKSYEVTFVPDAADCAAGETPLACARTQVDATGTCSAAGGREFADYYHTATVVSAQGISQVVLDYYARRGATPIKWRQVRVAADGDFTTPDSTYWDVYFYTIENQVPRLCTVQTTTDPSSSLPSAALCH